MKAIQLSSFRLCVKKGEWKDIAEQQSVFELSIQATGTRIVGEYATAERLFQQFARRIRFCGRFAGKGYGILDICQTICAALQ